SIPPGGALASARGCDTMGRSREGSRRDGERALPVWSAQPRSGRRAALGLLLPLRELPASHGIPGDLLRELRERARRVPRRARDLPVVAGRDAKPLRALRDADRLRDVAAPRRDRPVPERIRRAGGLPAPGPRLLRGAPPLVRHARRPAEEVAREREPVPPSSPILRASLLLLATLPLLGCPPAIYAIPTLLHPPPRSAGGATDPRFVPVALDFQTEGQFLLFRARVDGRNLEPSAGPCRRWFLRRGADEAPTASRTFCNDDEARFYLAAGVPHTLELLIGSQHTVAQRAYVQPGANLRWRMPITTRRIELSIDPEPGHAYTVRAREEALDLAAALKDAPTGTRWDPAEHEAVYYRGRVVGTLRLEVLRSPRRELVSELAVPLYSGRMPCEPPFCEAGSPQAPENSGGSDGASMRTNRSG